jgi:transketolase
VTGQKIRRLQAHAAQMRYDVVRMIENVGSGHPGGSLSCVDILACLYYEVMNVRPGAPASRDRFILSKGHAAPALYAVLGRTGYFSPHEFRSLRQIGGILEGHPDCRVTPGVDMTTGPLGQGVSAGAGMALAGRMDGKDYYVYVITSDGEMGEGQIWEAAQFAAHMGLDHLVVILDYNGLQFDGTCKEVLDLGDIAGKWRTFGWHTQEIDGHNHRQILDALAHCKTEKARPHFIIARTSKGKGVSFMENDCKWHSLIDREMMRNYLPKLAEEIQEYADVLDAPDIW